MYDDIIEKFRKEYYKEVWSISAVSSPGNNTSLRFIPTPSEIPIGIYKNEKWECVRFQKNTLLPIIEKYLEQICERYRQYSENDLMSILPELGVVSPGDTLLKFIKSIYVMYSIISTRRTERVNDLVSKSFKFKAISEGLRKIKSVPDVYPFLYSKEMNDTYRDITKRRLLRQELCRIKRTFLKELTDIPEVSIYRSRHDYNSPVEDCRYVGYNGWSGQIKIILDSQGKEYRANSYSNYLDNHHLIDDDQLKHISQIVGEGFILE